MAVEGDDRSQKAPAIASSTPQAESSPAPESLTLALAQPSSAPQEHAASLSELVATTDVPEDAIGGERDSALRAAGSSQSGRRVPESMGETGTEIQGFEAPRFDPPGFRRPGSGFLFRSTTSPFSAGGKGRIEDLPEPSTKTRLTELGGHPVETLIGGAPCVPTPRRNIGVIGDRRLAAREPAGPEMAMVPWRPQRPHAPHVGTPHLLLEPARTKTMATGPEPLRAKLEPAGLLPCRQHQQAQSSLGSERPIEPAREQSVPRHLAVAPSRPDNSGADFVLISREDVRHGWADLQARRRECEELRRHSHSLTTELAQQALHTHALQQECWHLHQALGLHQTPLSRNSIAGQRRSGVCGDCFGPAEVMLAPCSHIALCHGCYLKRQECPCCGLRFAFQR